MGVRDTQVGEPDQPAEPVEAATGARRVLQTLRSKLARWSQVHASQQVDLLAGQRTDR